MNKFLECSFKIKEDLIKYRRFLHQNAEGGSEIRVTSNYVQSILDDLGIEYKVAGNNGIIGDIGKGDKTILLRADMDALPIIEDNDLSFKSITNYSHCCGHDLHTTMLLGAIRNLKKYENELNGRVRFMFQPDEEGGSGAKSIIEENLLDDISIDAALALHVDAKRPLGYLDYGKGQTFASNDSFEIIVTGKGGHGARAFETIDPINIAFNLYSSLYSMINREVNQSNMILFSITSVQAGNSYNTIPSSAIVKGTLRTYNEAQRLYVMERITDIVEQVPKVFKGNATIRIDKHLPPLETSPELTEEVLKYAEDIIHKDMIHFEPIIKLGSEDFAYVTNKIKNSAYVFIGAGINSKEGYKYGQHSPNVIFNEDVLHIGSALLSNIAFRWLNNN